MTKRPLDDLVRIHKALSHPVRLRILGMLRGGPLCVCQINAVVGLAASTISQHLSELKRAGLVIEKKDGRWVEYRLAEAGETRDFLETIWLRLESDPTSRADSILLEELRRIPLETLCSAGLDLERLGRRVERAAARAQHVRSGTPGAT